jgi:hypothetical protein
MSMASSVLNIRADFCCNPQSIFISVVVVGTHTKQQTPSFCFPANGVEAAPPRRRLKIAHVICRQQQGN